LRHAIRRVRKMTLVAGDDVIGLCGLRAVQKCVPDRSFEKAWSYLGYVLVDGVAADCSEH
jgi:hypothetical protein